MNRKFSKEQIDWLRAGYLAWRIPELTRRFNTRFGADKSEEQIRACTRNRNMRAGRKPGMAKGEVYFTWGLDKIAWLREYRATGPIGEITARLNAVFGWNATPAMVSNACKRHGISAGSSGRFAKRNRPWNKGLEGYMPGGRSLATRFANGNRPHTELPVWSYKQEADRYWYLKVSDDQPATMSRRNWRAVHRLTWESVHGPIPPVHVVVLLDGDPDNCLDPGNLACLHRRVLVRLNAMNWDALCPDVAARRAVVALTSLQDAAHRSARDVGLSRNHSRALLPPITRFHDQPQESE